MVELSSLAKIFIGLTMTLVSKVVPIAAAILGFGFVIFVHECGHFLLCKAFNVSVPSFSLGFGPVLVQKKLWGTEFRISAIPLGGYNEIKDELAEDLSGGIKPAPDSFRSKPYWQKLAILLGGIVSNLALAVILFAGISWLGPSRRAVKEFEVVKITKDAPADKAGVEKGHTIIGMDDLIFKDNKKFDMGVFSQKLQENLGEEVNLHVRKPDGIEHRLKIRLNDLATAQKTGSAMGVVLNPIQGDVIDEVRPGFFQSIANGFTLTWFYATGTLKALKQIVVRKSVDLVGGPVMIISQGFKHARDGFFPLIFILAYISVSLAILNLLPIGALDGGRVLVETIEALVGRSIPNLRIATNLGTLLLLLFFVFLTYKDFYRIFSGE